MKRLITCFLAVLCAILTLNYISYRNENTIDKNYINKFGDSLAYYKPRSIPLQKAAAKRGDNLFIYGSSELDIKTDKFHPSDFFKYQNMGFQVNIQGRAGYQCLVHAADFGTMGKSLKDQKVVFVLSPQWFTKKGIDINTFLGNTPFTQIYGILTNKDLSFETKRIFAERFLEVTNNYNKKLKRQDKGTLDEVELIRTYCKMYTIKEPFNHISKALYSPFFSLRYNMYISKDKIDTIAYLKKVHLKDAKGRLLKRNLNNLTPKDFNKEQEKAEKSATLESTNNPFGMEDKVFDKKFRNKLLKSKDSMKNSSYDNSPEYTDYELLLRICKETGIKPLIINIPVNGYWYDYCGFNKEDRQVYYDKVKALTKKYGFKMADFSNKEYDKYFLRDGTHIGWKGWVDVNEAIYDYYKK